MEQEKIDRINALARKSRGPGLSAAEKEEQKTLRDEYIAAFRGNLKRQLDNLEIIRPDGSRHILRKSSKPSEESSPKHRQS